MNYNIGNHTYISNYHEGKKGYVNKFETSLKLPFLNVLHNHLPSYRPILMDELEIDDSDIVMSDNIELSSAVTKVLDVNATDTGDATEA